MFAGAFRFVEKGFFHGSKTCSAGAFEDAIGNSLPEKGILFENGSHYGVPYG